MRCPWLVLPLLLLLASVLPGAAATPTPQDGHYDDTVGDAPPGLDIVRVRWHFAASWQVNLTLDGAPDPDASYTVLLMRGEAGASQPAEWYILHHGPGGTTLLDGTASDGVERPLQADMDGETLRFAFDPEAASEGPCAFAVAQSSLRRDGERELADAAPSRDTDLGTVWNDGLYCGGFPHEEAVVVVRDGEDGDGLGIPAPGVAAVLAALVAVTAWRRR